MNRIPCRNKGYGLEHSTGHGINKARDTVMSDSEDSTVTYTVVSSPFADLPDIGSPGVDGPTVMPEDPYAYVVAAFQASSSPDYVSVLSTHLYQSLFYRPVYLEFMHRGWVSPSLRSSLTAAAHPTADSPGYVLRRIQRRMTMRTLRRILPIILPTEETMAMMMMTRMRMLFVEGDEEEKEHPAPADSTAVALPVGPIAPSAKETEPFETDESVATPPPHPAYRVTARILI
ncbi:hypothetical protein Tco_1292889 [Tanacetum coccineum]